MKPSRLVAIVLLLLICGGVAYWYFDWLDHSQDVPILAAAQRYGVDPALVKAVVWRESRFDPETIGTRGEFGLMQIIPAGAGHDWAEAEHLSPPTSDDLLDPGTNTLVGSWYLQKLLKRYLQTDNPLPYALADYNAGRGNVLKWNQGRAATNSATFIQQIGFPGTRSYVQEVSKRYAHYHPVFPPRTNK